MYLAVLFLFTLLGGEVLGQTQSSHQKLCLRIANHCRSSCQAFWDECHEEVESGNMMKPVVPTPNQQQALSTLVPILIPTRKCMQYRDACGKNRPCCKGYNCRYHADGSGIGLCF